MPFFRDRCICILYSHLTDENGVYSQAVRKPTEPDQTLQYPQQIYLSYSLQASSSRQVLYNESETHKKTDVTMTLGCWHVSPTRHVSESNVHLRESRGSTTLCWKGAKHHPEKKEKATQHYLEKQKKATQHHAEKQHTTQHSASGWWREKLFKLAPSLMSSS
jgi:hypothetical protein